VSLLDLVYLKGSAADDGDVSGTREVSWCMNYEDVKDASGSQAVYYTHYATKKDVVCLSLMDILVFRTYAICLL
jgi:hypothetical protein